MRTNRQQIRQTGRIAKRMKGAFMLLRMIEDFLYRTGMPWTKFGRIVAHDPRLVGDMRNGRSPRPNLAARIETYIHTYSEMPHAL